MTSIVSSWDNLPRELIFIIRDNLTLVTDCIRFGAVCKRWRSAYLEAKEERKQSSSDKILSISIHKVANAKSGQSIELYINSFQDKQKSDWCKRRSSNFRACCGTSYGIIAFQDRIGNFHLHDVLLNKNTVLQPIFQGLGKGQRVAFSSNPNTTPVKRGLSVAFLLGVSSVCRIELGEGNNWTYYNDLYSILEDIIFHKGKMFVVNWNGKLWVDDGHNDGGGGAELGLFAEKVISNGKEVSKMKFEVRESSKMYLVESSKGELLLVCRYYYTKDGYKFQATTGFRVYKMVMKERKWEEIENLNENEALFIGGNEGVCILISRFVDNNIEPNCIYFTKDCSCPFDRIYDSGFYSLGNKRLVRDVDSTEGEVRGYRAFLYGIGSDCWLTKLFLSNVK